MSYAIYYQVEALRFNLEDGGPPRFLVASECGSNNRYDKGNHRARDWQTLYVGTFDQVMASATYYATEFEGGGSKMYGTDNTPEAMLRKIARLMQNSSEMAPDDIPIWPQVKLPENHHQQVKVQDWLRHRNLLGLGQAVEQKPIYASDPPTTTYLYPQITTRAEALSLASVLGHAPWHYFKDSYAHWRKKT